MRLGIDASNLREGGGITHLSELLRAATPAQHGIDRVVVWAGRNAIRRMPTKPWLECFHEPLLDRVLVARLYWQKTRLSHLAKQHCDYLFVPGGSYNGDFRPFVTMSRNLLPFEKVERRRYGFSWMSAKMFLLSSIQARTFRNADGVIFLTEYARSVVTRATNLNGRQRIIPHGLHKRFHLAPRVQKPLSTFSKDHPFRLLYVSKIEPYKHHWQVVEAVARLRRQGIPVVLDLVGGTASSSAMLRLTEAIKQAAATEDFIHVLGQVRHAELPEYYHRADGFVFASSCENLPNILLEAMAAGLPIASSDRGPMPEVLGDAGVYFDPQQPQDIAAALKRLIEDHALRERCAWSAFERAQTYSWKRCATETLAYLAELARC